MGPELGEAEWEIIIELLERERSELPVEIRHTYRHAFRGYLQRRLEIIDALLERIKARASHAA